MFDFILLHYKFRFRLIWPRNWWPEDVQGKFPSGSSPSSPSDETKSGDGKDRGIGNTDKNQNKNENENRYENKNGNANGNENENKNENEYSDRNINRNDDHNSPIDASLNVNTPSSTSTSSVNANVMPVPTLPLRNNNMSTLIDSENVIEEKEGKGDGKKLLSPTIPIPLPLSSAAAALASISSTTGWIRDEVKRRNSQKSFQYNSAESKSPGKMKSPTQELFSDEIKQSNHSSFSDDVSGNSNSNIYPNIFMNNDGQSEIKHRNNDIKKEKEKEKEKEVSGPIEQKWRNALGDFTQRNNLAQYLQRKTQTPTLQQQQQQQQQQHQQQRQETHPIAKLGTHTMPKELYDEHVYHPEHQNEYRVRNRVKDNDSNTIFDGVFEPLTAVTSKESHTGASSLPPLQYPSSSSCPPSHPPSSSPSSSPSSPSSLAKFYSEARGRSLGIKANNQKNSYISLKCSADDCEKLSTIPTLQSDTNFSSDSSSGSVINSGLISGSTSESGFNSNLMSPLGEVILEVPGLIKTDDVSDSNLPLSPLPHSPLLSLLSPPPALPLVSIINEISYPASQLHRNIDSSHKYISIIQEHSSPSEHSSSSMGDTDDLLSHDLDCNPPLSYSNVVVDKMEVATPPLIIAAAATTSATTTTTTTTTTAEEPSVARERKVRALPSKETDCHLDNTKYLKGQGYDNRKLIEKEEKEKEKEKERVPEKHEWFSRIGEAKEKLQNKYHELKSKLSQPPPTLPLPCSTPIRSVQEKAKLASQQLSGLTISSLSDLLIPSLASPLHSTVTSGDGVGLIHLSSPIGTVSSSSSSSTSTSTSVLSSLPPKLSEPRNHTNSGSPFNNINKTVKGEKMGISNGRDVPCVSTAFTHLQSPRLQPFRTRNRSVSEESSSRSSKLWNIKEKDIENKEEREEKGRGEGIEDGVRKNRSRRAISQDAPEQFIGKRSVSDFLSFKSNPINMNINSINVLKAINKVMMTPQERRYHLYRDVQDERNNTEREENDIQEEAEKEKGRKKAGPLHQIDSSKISKVSTSQTVLNYEKQLDSDKLNQICIDSNNDYVRAPVRVGIIQTSVHPGSVWAELTEGGRCGKAYLSLYHIGDRNGKKFVCFPDKKFERKIENLIVNPSIDLMDAGVIDVDHTSTKYNSNSHSDISVGHSNDDDCGSSMVIASSYDVKGAECKLLSSPVHNRDSESNEILAFDTTALISSCPDADLHALNLSSPTNKIAQDKSRIGHIGDIRDLGSTGAKGFGFEIMLPSLEGKKIFLWCCSEIDVDDWMEAIETLANS